MWITYVGAFSDAIALKCSLGRRVRRILGTTRRLAVHVGGRAAIAVVVVGLCGTTGAGLVGVKSSDSSESEVKEGRSELTRPVKRTVALNTEPRPDGGAGYRKRYPIDGFELEAGFTPDKAECILGEPIFITFSAKNLADKTYGFHVGGDNRGSVRHNRFRITAVDSNGKPVKDPHSYVHHGGFGRDVVLKPGESYTERLYLGFWCAFEKPGVYDVNCERTLTADGGDAKYPAVAVVTTFKLTIQPFDKEKMGRAVAELGKKLREGDQQAVYEATLGLSEIDDEAVIPHLAVSLAKGDFRNRAPAVKGLSRFSTDAAADALIVALRDPDYVVGQAAGEALRKNNMTDRAVDALLKDLRSPLSSERALAARALGYTGSRRAFDPLVRAMEDARAEVGEAAAEALGELGHKEALEPLKKRVEGPVMGVRVGASKGLMALGEALQVEWLTPVIKNTTSVNDQNFHESIRLIRLYGKERAAAALISCLNFDDPSLRNSYNFFLMQGIEASPGGPKCFSIYNHDPNVDGTPQQIEENRKVLEALKTWLTDFEGKKGESSSPGSGHGTDAAGKTEAVADATTKATPELTN